MQSSKDTATVRVTQRFWASAESVFDGFLDSDKARHFLFSSPTGEIVKCEIDGRAGGKLVVVDRIRGADVEHTGTFVEVSRPKRIVLTFSAPKAAPDVATVTIDVAARDQGCEVTLTHALNAKYAEMKDIAREVWSNRLAVAAEVIVAEAPTCGIGLAQHASIPAAIGVMFEGLAETLELHRKMLQLDDENARKEDAAYSELAAAWREISTLVARTAAKMDAQWALPMGAHDESAWGPEHVRAFEKFVNGELATLALLKVAAARDEQMIASMKQH